MVSFDIKLLFRNVPVYEVVQVEDDTLEDRTTLTITDITNLLELCLKTTYFTFRGEFYKQTDGAAMGSPLVANIYMEMFEELALRTAPHAPRVWRRYVDDTFCIMEREHVDQFLRHINNLRPTIQFTMELEEERHLPFLDILLTWGTGGRVDTSVYRKKTHTERYFQYSLHHPTDVKRGVLFPQG